RFPRLRPLRAAPSLSRVAGIGCVVRGRRDADAPTGTYVTTHYFTLFFVPLFALGAYRVSDAPEGWYFHGREPLSPGARAWNAALACLLLGVAGLVWWNGRVASPASLARKQIAEADRLAAAGEVEKAAALYREVGRDNTEAAGEAAERFVDLLNDR